MNVNRDYEQYEGLVLSFLKDEFETIPFGFKYLEKISRSLGNALKIIQDEESNRGR